MVTGWFSTGWFALRGHLATSGEIWVSTRRGDVFGIWWAEARIAASDPTVHEMPSCPAENYLVRAVPSARGRNPAVGR